LKNISKNKPANILKSKRAVSPVIATVILVAVAITVSVAVAYWMGGIAGQYTTFEQVEIQSVVCTIDGTSSNWEIIISLKNTGTATATLTNVFVNDIQCSTYGAVDPDDPTPTAVDTITTDLTITPAYALGSGDSDTVIIWVGANYATLSSGTTVNIKIHSAGGMDYIKLIELV